MSEMTAESSASRGLGSPGSDSAASILSTALDQSQTQPAGTLQCCCGQVGCIYLQHNCSVLDSVENDVRTAAKLGQVRP